MILSICIPVYNQYIDRLIKSLELGMKFIDGVEIVCIDDASDEKFKTANAKVLKNHKYYENYKNKGRSVTRNAFLDKTKGDYLLFLDCDSEIVKSNFIKRYVDFTLSRTRVACGGMQIPNEMEKGCELRYKYAKEVELNDFITRLEQPHIHFKTNNFLIRRDIFEKHKFSTQLKGYGHEDTLMAFNLKRKRIPIDHLDNPVLHAHIDTNIEFVDKTKEALKNLAKLHAKKGDSFGEFVRLLDVYNRLKKNGGLVVLSIISPFIKVVLASLCKSGKASVKVFNWYKLLLFVGYRRKLKSK